MILSPLIIISFMVLLYTLFIGLAYIQFNNLANVVAQDMNMRQSGYEDTGGFNPSITFNHDQSSITSDGSGTLMDGFRQFVGGFDATSNTTTMAITGNSANAQSGARYSVNNHKDRFQMPGVSVQEVNVNAMRNGVAASDFGGSSMSGTIIETTITYKCFGLTFRGVGYNIIS